MKVLGVFGVAAATVWFLCLFGIGFQRFIEWRERRRYDREVFDPSYVRMIDALEDIVQ